MIKAIIFDLWRTLCHNEKFLNDLFLTLKAKNTMKSIRMLEESTMLCEFESEDEKIESLVKAFGLGLDDEIKQRLKEIYDFRKKTSDVYGDTIPALEELKNKYKLILLSNTDDPDEIRVFDKIKHYFDKVFISSITGHLKPDKDAFMDVINSLGLDRSEVVMVGDSKRCDAVSQEFGIRAIIIDRDDRYEGENIINSLIELEQKIKK